MAWSYSGDPRTSDKDAVRVIIGDTIQASPLLQDEEILYFLEEAGSVIGAAVAAACAIASRFARLSDETTGDIQRRCSQKYKQYKDLSDQLRADANDPLSINPAPFAGGISLSDIDARREDEDRYPDIFNIGETDNVNGPSVKGQDDLDDGMFFSNN